MVKLGRKMQRVKLLTPLSVGACLLLLFLIVALATVTGASAQGPPATYYGPVLAGPGFTPTAGMLVTAWIDGNLCGQSETLEVSGQIVYTINVLAEGPGGAAGCGALGRVVTFQVGFQVMVSTAKWDNSRVWERPLLRCCDFDGDGVVTVVDIMQVVSRWGCKCGDICYNPLYDLNGDCDTDVEDIMKVAAHWRETCG